MLLSLLRLLQLQLLFYFADSLLNDWFLGRELNPRLGSLDIKYVLFRSGIIGWILFNTVNLLQSREILGYHSPTMIGLFLMQLLYVVDYFWFEGGVLVSRDIVHEGLGYNILIQFLMIPFCFCVHTKYLVTRRYQLPWYYVILVGTLNGKPSTFILQISTFSTGWDNANGIEWYNQNDFFTHIQ